MPKRKKGVLKDLPLEGLWVSPEGERIPVVEHLITIQHHPETFGLSLRDVHGASIHDLHLIAEDLIRDGWIRFRYLANVWAFEVNHAKRKIGFIGDILSEGGACADEPVSISQVSPRREFQATVNDVFDQKIFGYQENPKRNRWRFS